MNTPFFESILGKVIRWIVFIPLGFILFIVIEFITYISINYFLDHWLGYLILFFILGIPFFFIIVIFYQFYYKSICLSVATVCPVSKIGVGIFGTLYFFQALTGVIGTFGMNFPTYKIVIFFIAKLAFIITAVIALVKSYNDEVFD